MYVHALYPLPDLVVRLLNFSVTSWVVPGSTSHNRFAQLRRELQGSSWVEHLENEALSLTAELNRWTCDL